MTTTLENAMDTTEYKTVRADGCFTDDMAHAGMNAMVLPPECKAFDAKALLAACRVYAAMIHAAPKNMGDLADKGEHA